MSDQQSSYRQIMKATSLFGGVQVFNIIISVIRSKFVAVLLGPNGMGIMGLFLSTIGIISKGTNFGLETSAVKDIAAASGTGNEKRIGIVATVIQRMVWVTGLIGLVITALFSPWLSQLTFGNRDYSLAFVWLSITILINQLSNGQLVILQGLRKLKYLAKANLSGSLISLFVTIPLYYIWGLDGIVPSIIGTSMLSMLFSWYFSNKIKIKKHELTKAQTFVEGKSMLQIGFLISLSGFFSVTAAHIVRLFISHSGSVEQVGLYNAGFVIINTYVGLIFTAMGKDFYPRLSAVSHDNQLCKQAINQQAEIALLILGPILILFLIFINWIVVLLYSKEFISVSGMLYWASIGMFFKASSWAIGFIFLAKSDSKLYFVNEFTANLLKLVLNIGGYYLGGLTGLGISFVISYLIYLVQVYMVSNLKFQFEFNRSYFKIFSIQLALIVAGLLTTMLFEPPNKYFIGTVLIGISGFYSLFELKKKLGLGLSGLVNKYKPW
ncbi:MAG TPA: O-antigen translocase [Prolixibacteraceae bacterium]|nr:O-antigen translocase [Prolixibacteraceae bacterium]